jgi:hypothetical protein
VLLLGCLGAAVAQTPGTPYLYFRLITPHGIQRLQPGRAVQVSNNSAIQLEVCVRARTVEDRFEQPDIEALNKGPEYFSQRPPANIVLTLNRVLPEGRQEMPFRVNSSGGGKDLAVYFVMVEIDMLEDRAVRLKRAVQFVDWMLTQSPADTRSQMLLNSPAKERLIEHFEETYINNPPGDYEIAARYTPTTQENWKGNLVSAPARIHVVQSGDFFDAIKAKQANKAGVIK